MYKAHKKGKKIQKLKQLYELVKKYSLHAQQCYNANFKHNLLGIIPNCLTYIVKNR